MSMQTETAPTDVPGATRPDVATNAESGDDGAEPAEPSEPDDPASPGRSPGDDDVRAPGPVEIVCAAELGPTEIAWLRDRLAAAIPHVGATVARLTVRVVDDAAMTALHARHLDVAAPTDVLTFAASVPGAPIEADIAVDVDEARRMAGPRGLPVERELLLYALHGLLHCAGHDDHDDEAFRAMHAAEDRILRAIGVGATFTPDDTPPGRAPREDAP